MFQTFGMFPTFFDAFDIQDGMPTAEGRNFRAGLTRRLIRCDKYVSGSLALFERIDPFMKAS